MSSLAPVFFRTLKLLRYASNPKAITAPEEIGFSHDGIRIPIDLYRNLTNKNAPALIISTGFTKNGNKDERVRQLASGFQAIGFSVFVPEFPDAVQLKISSRTLDQLIATIHYTSNHPDIDSNCVGIFGVSYGGTLALLAAARSELKGRVQWIATLGCYASIENLISFSFTGNYPKNGATFPISPDPYLRTILESSFGSGTDPIKILAESSWLSQLQINEDFVISPSIHLILAHSQNDPVVPWPELDVLRDHLTRKGISSKRYLIEMKEHARLNSWLPGFQIFRFAYALARTLNIKR